MIAIIDYDAGNIKSVEKALLSIGETPVLTRDPEVILQADHIILPGVGSFGDAMENLNKFGLIDVIHEAINRKIPFLGICLGLQLLFESSEETPGVTRPLCTSRQGIIRFVNISLPSFAPRNF